jgi:hypothetical protein
VPGLSDCRTIITCDGYQTARGRVRYKTGRIAPAMARAYDEFLRRLQREVDAACPRHRPLLRNISLMVFSRRQGFGFAVKHALQAATTRYALVRGESAGAVAPVTHARPLACDRCVWDEQVRVQRLSLSVWWPWLMSAVTCFSSAPRLCLSPLRRRCADPAARLPADALV